MSCYKALYKHTDTGWTSDYDLQIYCLVCFERICKICQHLANLQVNSGLRKRRVRRGTVLLKDAELA